MNEQVNKWEKAHLFYRISPNYKCRDNKFNGKSPLLEENLYSNNCRQDALMNSEVHR